MGSIAHFVDGDADRQYDSGSETLFDKFDYSYFADGSRASETRTNADGTTTVEWSYDGLNRLIEEEFDGFDGQGDPLAYTDTYSFNLSSNRTKLVHDDQTSGGGGSAGPDSTTTYEYDANDRLLAETKDVAGSTTEDRHTVYGYGPTDQTSKTVHEGLDDQGAVAQDIDFIYDATGRMTGVTMAVGSTTTTVTYRYDHNGFRVEARVDDGTNPPVTTIFHVDPANPTGYAQVVEQGVDADSDGRLDASEIEKAFVIGLDLLTQATASALLHLLTDAHGSTKAVLNAATSSVLERYVYSAYGLDLGLGSSPATAFRYSGEFIDPVSGLSFNRARWYDPSNGRWNRLDPFAGRLDDPLSFHKYLYGAAEPVMSLDPSGFTSYADIMMAVGIRSYLMALYFAGYSAAVTAIRGVAAGMTTDEVMKEVILEQLGLIGEGIRLLIDIVQGPDYWVHYGDEPDDGTLPQSDGNTQYSRVSTRGRGIVRPVVFNLSNQQKQLVRMVRSAVKAAPGGLVRARGHADGSRVHGNLAGIVRQIRRHRNVELWDEVSYKRRGGELKEDYFGQGASPSGSVRVDVVIGEMGRPEMIFDLKTGSARLSAARVAAIRAQLPEEFKDIPIVGIRVD